MSQAKSLRERLSGGREEQLSEVARYVEGHVSEQWEAILERHAEKLRDAYARAGDMAYGTYLNLLFRPVHRQLGQAGLRVSPKLPGDFEISREWGVPDETEQQRWMWSALEDAEGEPLGTLVTITYHDHTGFRVPRQPGVLALAEVGEKAVVAALSARSADFAVAREARIEIAEYLASVERQR